MTEPFVMLPKSLLRSPLLSLTAKVLLSRLANNQDGVHGECNPKIDTLAIELGVSRRTIERALVELSETGLIQVMLGQRASHYQVAPRSQWSKILIRQHDVAEPSSDTPKWRRQPRQNDTSDGSASLFSEKTLINRLSVVCAGDSSRIRQPKITAQAETATTTAGKKRSSKNENKNGADDLALTLRNELLAQHPSKGNPKKALAVLSRILAATTDPPAFATQIRESHRAWREEWSARLAHSPQAFIPYLHVWFESEEYLHPPSATEIETKRRKTTSVRRGLPSLKELIDA